MHMHTNVSMYVYSVCVYIYIHISVYICTEPVDQCPALHPAGLLGLLPLARTAASLKMRLRATARPAIVAMTSTGSVTQRVQVHAHSPQSTHEATVYESWQQGLEYCTRRILYPTYLHFTS